MNDTDRNEHIAPLQREIQSLRREVIELKSLLEGFADNHNWLLNAYQGHLDDCKGRTGTPAQLSTDWWAAQVSWWQTQLEGVKR